MSLIPLASALTLSIGAAVIKGTSAVIEDSDDAEKLALVENVWVTGNKWMLLVLVLVPVLVNTVLLVLCLYTTFRLHRGMVACEQTPRRALSLSVSLSPLSLSLALSHSLGRSSNAWSSSFVRLQRPTARPMS